MDSDAAGIEAFIGRWKDSAGAERANYQLFLSELCDLIGVARPNAATGGSGDYRFERQVIRHELDGTDSIRRIDLYKRGCFVLEAKQASERPTQASLFERSDDERRSMFRQSKGWAQAMLRAKGQAEAYARDVPNDWPPIIIVCDIGFCFDIYADFTGSGKHYAQFPNQKGYRLYLDDLRDAAIRDHLRTIWTDPLSLDPGRRRLEVTSGIGVMLAKLTKALEARGHPADSVATFLMRSVFCMFAQSVNLLPSKTAFTDLLEDCRGKPPSFLVSMLGEMWRTMDKGGFSAGLRADLRHFNGGLFAPGPHGPVEPLPLDAEMLDLLAIASRRDWSEVEPAIFGTLLENAIERKERAALGAHFTPRAFIERLVQPALMDPLQTEWDGVKAAVDRQLDRGEKAAAAKTVRDFHARLCALRVLDPACGSGNFLYVALDLLKRLESDVLEVLADLEPGEGGRFDLTLATVDPHQFLGLELNPRAVPVAELVLWLGWLQWHFRNRPGRELPEPILRDFHNIQEQDALLDYREHQVVAGATRWGGRTKVHPITGEEVPDETDRVVVLRPKGAKPRAWPVADFIIGNPPFVGAKYLREHLGDGYAEALWAAYPKVNRGADLALFFWWKAAQAVAKGTARRFGFITSNSLRQVLCRKVVAAALEARIPLHLVFAVPDHPWTDGTGSAAVRIAMSVVGAGPGEGVLAFVSDEREGEEGVPEITLETRRGAINADLTIGIDMKSAKPLRANERIASAGVKLHGAGFIVTPVKAAALGLGRVPGLEAHIRPYLNGRDLQQRSREAMVIDLYGMTEAQVRTRFPAAYQHVLLTVKPERDQNNRAARRDSWWVFGEPSLMMRDFTRGLTRYIATVATAKHRVFGFIDGNVLPDDALIVIGSDDAFHLGVLQSRQHVAFALEAGGRLEDRPRYNKFQCFDPFPFPPLSILNRNKITAIAEELDAHRKSRLAAHSHLTLTRLYNVLAALRAGTPLSPEERDIHEAGQVSILRRLHDDLDAAVADAYGWPRDLSAAAIVERVVALNAERRAEEAAGQVRWLRPAYQAPAEALRPAPQATLDIEAEAAATAHRWPREEAAQFVALRAALRGGPMAARDVARRFQGAPRGDRLPRMLETLVALGQARALDGGRFSA